MDRPREVSIADAVDGFGFGIVVLSLAVEGSRQAAGRTRKGGISGTVDLVISGALSLSFFSVCGVEGVR